VCVCVGVRAVCVFFESFVLRPKECSLLFSVFQLKEGSVSVCVCSRALVFFFFFFFC